MKKFALLIIAVVSFSFATFASAQECKQLCIAKEFYEQGDAVIISGRFDAVLPNTPLIIQVFKDNNRVHIAQVEVSQDGSYTYTLIADGPYFKTDGKYTVQASYGVAGNVYEATFEYRTKESASTTTNIFEVNAGQYGTFDIPYTIRGGTVKNILVDPDILGLIVTIDAEKDGTLTMDLERRWIDAKKNDGTDDTYIILIDGLEVPYQETTDADSRLITIQFQAGDSDIEIIGTFVVPEFGPLVAAVLVAAVTSVILLSKRIPMRIS
ncbi:MAG TPA: PEFG-CTERM sorting domain-containing protein [Candidatus Nitrosotenuis sp.]|nr:PEFG-CTERM sorting domain-containing protein [Candidatus Nitrosotenuis sp.]